MDLRTLPRRRTFQSDLRGCVCVCTSAKLTKMKMNNFRLSVAGKSNGAKQKKRQVEKINIHRV